jgi:hypothetical protein
VDESEIGILFKIVDFSAEDRLVLDLVNLRQKENSL